MKIGGTAKVMAGMMAEEMIEMEIVIEDTAVGHPVGKGNRGEAEIGREAHATEEIHEMLDMMIGEEGGEMLNLAEQAGKAIEVRLMLLVMSMLIDPSLTTFKRVDETREAHANDLEKRDEAVAHGARRTKETIWKRRGKETGRG